MKALSRLSWVICTGLLANAFAADPDPSRRNERAQPVVHKSGQIVLVDDTITDGQLKQIVAKGYRPTKQGPGNEVYYCRSEQLSGDRFLTTVCKTAHRIFEDERRGKDLTESISRIGLQTGTR